MEAALEIGISRMAKQSGRGSQAADALKGVVDGQAAKNTRRGLLAFIRRQIEDIEEAEDILQDVYYQLVENFDPEDPISNITGWMYTVARNKITDWYRKRATRGIPAKLEAAEMKTGRELNADFAFDQNILWQATMEALDELPENQREVFIKNEFEGISFREMSEANGISINTLLSRKRAAVLALRERLQDVYDEMD